MFDHFHDRVELLRDGELPLTPLIQRILVRQLEALLIGDTEFALSLLQRFYDGVNDILGGDLLRLLAHAHLPWKLTVLFAEGEAPVCVGEQRSRFCEDVWLRLFAWLLLGRHHAQKVPCVGGARVLLLHESGFLSAGGEIVNIRVRTLLN